MATQQTKGFALPCPKCHEETATLALDLTDLETVRCLDCDETFTLSEARDEAAAALARWEALIRWTEAAPADPE